MYKSYLCKGCHDLKQKVVSFNDVAIVTLKKMLTESLLVYEER